MLDGHSGSGRYRYEATVTLVIAADSLDAAYRVQQAAARNADLIDGVIEARSPMMRLHHRPDLDGSLVVQTPEGQA